MDIQEMKENLDRVQRELETLRARVSDVEKSHSINDVVMNSVDRRLGSIEDTMKWIVKLIIGAIITGLITAVMALVFTTGG